MRWCRGATGVRHVQQPPWDARARARTGRARCRFLPARRRQPLCPATQQHRQPAPAVPRASRRLLISSPGALHLPFEFADFMGHLRRLMKELYEAGFCFKECTGLVDNFRITTRRYTCLRFSSPDPAGRATARARARWESRR